MVSLMIRARGVAFRPQATRSAIALHLPDGVMPVQAKVSLSNCLIWSFEIAAAW